MNLALINVILTVVIIPALADVDFDLDLEELLHEIQQSKDKEVPAGSLDKPKPIVAGSGSGKPVAEKDPEAATIVSIILGGNRPPRPTQRPTSPTFYPFPFPQPTASPQQVQQTLNRLERRVDRLEILNTQWRDNFQTMRENFRRLLRRVNALS